MWHKGQYFGSKTEGPLDVVVWTKAAQEIRLHLYQKGCKNCLQVVFVETLTHNPTIDVYILKGTYIIIINPGATLRLTAHQLKSLVLRPLFYSTKKVKSINSHCLKKVVFTINANVLRISHNMWLPPPPRPYTTGIGK